MGDVKAEMNPDARNQDAAIIDVGRWEVIQVGGAERLTFLHRLLTASLDGLQPGQGRRALLLTAKAQIVTEFIVCARAEDVLLLVPPGQGEVATAALSRYAIMDDVTFSLMSDRELIAICGADAAAALAAAGLSLSPHVCSGAPLSHAESDTVGLLTIRVPGYGSDGYWIVGQPAAITDLAGRLEAGGVPRLAAEVAEARRILAGEPKFGAEITGEVFPMEVALDPLIDYTKGCYLGQEPIVRIRDRGHVNWRLVGLRIVDPGPIAAGDRLESDSKPKAGRITSVATVTGQPRVALALVHVSLPVGSQVRVLHETSVVPAEVVELPPPAR
ncbi:MAG TPA: hypothetical protein VGG33_13690 [Polyangia bacterium]